MAIDPTDYVKPYAPLVRLFPYSDNPYMPCSVDWYLNTDAIVLYLLDGMYQPAPGTDFDQSELPTTLPPPPTPLPYLVNPDPTATSPIRSGDLPNAIAYVHILGPDPLTGSYDLQYWFFYAIRGLSALRIQGPLGLGDLYGDFTVPNGSSNGIGYQGVGEHQGDWKHVTVRIDSGGNIVAVYYAQHTGGFWCFPGQFSTTSTGGPIVYSARNTHSCFPTAGKFDQLGTIHNIQILKFSLLEMTADGGQEWNCSQNYQIITDTDPRWNAFVGNWGPGEEQDVATGLVNAIANAAIPYPFDDMVKGDMEALTALFGTIFPRLQSGPATPSQQQPWSVGDGPLPSLDASIGAITVDGGRP